MRAQSHVPSAAPRLDIPIGYAIEMDVMKWCAQLYLVSVCVASKMYFSTPVRGRSLEDIQLAVDDLASTFNTSGRELKQVSCDRESAVTVMGPYLNSKGISLDLKASGQKCPRVEVAIRGLKDTARSTYFSIQNSEGYLLPVGYLRQLLLMDALKTLNRRIRRGEVRSPYELFTGKKIDYTRDFRAPFGAVVAAHRPLRGVGRDTAAILAKAELGIVAVRPMDGTSVIGIYLPTKKSIIYTVKFERVRAPEWLLHDLKSHVTSDDIGWDEANGRAAASDGVSLEEGAGTSIGPGSRSREDDDDDDDDSSDNSSDDESYASAALSDVSAINAPAVRSEEAALWKEEVKSSENGDIASDSNRAPTGLQQQNDPAHAGSTVQLLAAVRTEPTDSIVTDGDSIQDSSESANGAPPDISCNGDADVLFGVNPDPYIRTKIREGLRPLRRKLYGENSVANKSEVRTTAKGPRRNSIFASFDSTKGYVSALLVSHGLRPKLSLSI